MKSYHLQYERMKRYYDQFNEIDKGRQHDRPTTYYEDTMHAFFQNCYHLKDWIKNETSLQLQIKGKSIDVEDFITKTRCMAICADLCNAQKHLVLTKPPRSGTQPSTSTESYHMKVTPSGPNPTEIAVKYSVNTSAGTIDAFKLATDCVDAWDKFLQANGLI